MSTPKGSLETILDALPARLEGYDLRAERDRALSLSVQDPRRRRAERPLCVARAGRSQSEHQQAALVAPRGAGPVALPGDSSFERADVGPLLEAFERDVVTGGARSAHGFRAIPTDSLQVGLYCLTPGDVTFDASADFGRALLSDDHPALLAGVANTLSHGQVLRRLADDSNRQQVVQSFSEELGGALTEELGSVRWRVLPVDHGREAADVVMRVGSARCLTRLSERSGSGLLARLAAELGSSGSVDLTMPPPVPLCRVLVLSGATAPAVSGVEVSSVGDTPADQARAVEQALERRPLTELLAEPGRLSAVLAAGRVPVELVAAVIVPGFDTRRLGQPVRGATVALWDLLEPLEIPLVLDETWSCFRSGQLLALSRPYVEPAAVMLGRGAPLCAVAFGPQLQVSLTGTATRWWGAGTGVLRMAAAASQLDILLHDRDQVLDGLSYRDNAKLKGGLLRIVLDQLADRWSSIVVDRRGHGLLQSLVVKDSGRVAEACRQQGLLMLEPDGDPACMGVEGALGLVFSADVLAAEIEDVAAALDAALEEASVLMGDTRSA